MPYFATRRSVLSGVALAGVPSVGDALPRARDQGFGAAIQRDLERFAGFGIKTSGGVGDNECGAWIEERLEALGYETRRQLIQVPFLDVGSARLSSGEGEAAIWVMPGWFDTPSWHFSMSGRLAWLDGPDPLAGAVALAELSYRRWSSASAPEVQQAIRRAAERQAQALVLVTHGPSGEAVALNISNVATLPLPVVIVGSKAAPVLRSAAWAKGEVTLEAEGITGRRAAFNVIGRRRGPGLPLVLSTPRSGWFDCVGERGSGVAAWLAVAEAARETAGSLELVCTSGHEWDSLGAEAYLAGEAPPPEAIKLWVHFGANFATRDAHELGPSLRFLGTADPQRYLAGASEYQADLRRRFQGQPGLETPYVVSASAAGELKTLVDHGYQKVIGVFGAHRLHHARTDSLDAVSDRLVRESALAMQQVIVDLVGSGA